jgi:hypothetical protein
MKGGRTLFTTGIAGPNSWRNSRVRPSRYSRRFFTESLPTANVCKSNANRVDLDCGREDPAGEEDEAP